LVFIKPYVYVTPNDWRKIMTTSTAIDNRVACALCGHKSHSLLDHVREAHNMTPQEYLAANPGHGLVSQDLIDKMNAGKPGTRRSLVSVPEDLKVKLGGYEIPVDINMGEGECLPIPKGYRFPTKGKAKKVFNRALRALVNGRNVYLWGPAGTGKDSIVHAFSYLTRRPVYMMQFVTGKDIAPEFYIRAMDQNGTGWDIGDAYKAVTEGIADKNGVRRAPLFLLSDVDRADTVQAEWFRLLTDSISGRIKSPSGKTVSLFRDPVTGKTAQFVCTANSVGTGDSRGRMVSSNPIDASIMDRLGKKIEAQYMHWDDESFVLKANHPELAALVGDDFWRGLGNCTASLRKAIQQGDIIADLTMRGLTDICEDAIDILNERKGKMPKDLLGMAMECWFDGLDEDNKFEAKRLADPNSNSLDLELDEDGLDY
jgi:hypothetical protein